ncbi:hypothetical protein NQ318_015037 [Aromia moschata]|uniref:C2H2-type domain-containing protein n=1 Tax=Aromia moschata TaxID=1265417 RepID=A0AAV8YZ07_9CUCU|nr:hypothetical protein NQ318_015037 [Aromia moschata]
MADDEYGKKLDSLQQYIPFLENMIQQLSDPTKKNREQQLNKMQSLYAMITDKKKKLKLETLVRCEDVISKLYVKVHNRPIGAKKSPVLTPASPSPPRDIPAQQPLTIPTERLENERPRIDIYSSAGESLNKSRYYNNLPLNTRVPDMSKPPISLEDLKTLEEDVQDKINETTLKSASLNELTNLKNIITEQIQLEDIKSKSPQKPKCEDINTTVRNNSTLTKKAIQSPDKLNVKEKTVDSPKPGSSKIKDPKPETNPETSPKKENKSNNTHTALKPKSPKVLKEPASIFGSVLSTIDDKILEVKKKKEDKKHSAPGKDEKRPDGGREKSKDKSSETKKEEKRNSSDKKSDDKGSSKKKSDKISSEDKGKISTKTEEKCSLSGKKSFEELEQSLKDKLKAAEEDQVKSAINVKDEENKDCKNEESNDAKDKVVTSRIFVRKETELKPTKEIAIENREDAAPTRPQQAPVFRRLADKYNPKPRKPALEADVDKAVADSIEEKMKSFPPKIPVINQLPEPVPPPASLILCSQAEPETPAPSAQLPAVLQNILNPSTTQLINNVVSHLRQTNDANDGSRTPLLPNPPSLLGNPPALLGNQPTLMGNPSLLGNPQSLMGSSPGQLAGNTPLLMSPPTREDNFVSEYCREQFNGDYGNPATDYGNPGQYAQQMRPRFEPPRSQFAPKSPRYGAPLMGEKYNENFAQDRQFCQPYGYQQNNHMDMQPLDYYPPNAPTPANQYNCGPPLLSPEIPHFHNEQKPAGFWRNEDTRMHWDRRDQDLRMSRDPRTYREYREMRERDPRIARDNRDQRDNRDPRDVSRDPRLNRDPRDREYRDPRLNKPRDDRDTARCRDNRFQQRDYRPNRYDSKFDRMYSRTNHERSRSRSRSMSQANETFVSPLDSLYTGKEEHRTGKGYGVQNFRIPKIKKEDESKGKDEECAKVTSTNEDLIIEDHDAENDEAADRNSDEEDQPEESKPEEIVVVEEEVAEQNKSAEEIKEPDVEKERSASPQPQKEASEPAKVIEPMEPEQPKVTSSQSAEPESKPADQTILAQFFANLLGSKNKRDKKTALYSLISTFSDSFSDKELSKITKIIKADDEDDDTSEEEDESKKPVQKPDDEKDAVKEPTADENEKEERIARPTRYKPRRRVRRISSNSPSKEDTNKEKEPITSPEPQPQETETKQDPSKEEDSVIVTVGERIKSRKRSSATLAKPTKKYRTELDMLHEDIQDMFIRDGVLTASGKRMCRILKDDPNMLASPPQPQTSSSDDTSPQKVRKKSGPKPKPKPPNPAEMRVMKSVRVIIPKMSDSDVAQRDESPKRILRRSTRNVAYVESDDESPVREGTPLADEESIAGDGSVREFESDAESTDNEKDKSAQSGETGQKSKCSKRKRGKGWALGIIPNKRKKKKQASIDEPEETAGTKDDTLESIALDPNSDKSYVEPDKNYYIDVRTNKSHGCKLCDYRGRFITTHYKTAHPESEILSSRFAPAVATEAIDDSNENLAKYESLMRIKGGGKLRFICRFCKFNTHVPPTLFYDHITTHTGEYRHICPECDFSASSGKTLKSHMSTAHHDTNKRIARKSYGQTIMFGYMCGECNYVQLSEKNVEDHINIFHLQKPVIHKVNMSTYLDPEIESIAQERETTNEQPPSPKNIEEPEERTEPEETTMPPPQRKKPGPKPGPKSAKRRLREKAQRRKSETSGAESDSVTDTESVTSKESESFEQGLNREEVPPKLTPPRRKMSREVSMDEEMSMTARSSRAAKEKATEKLKTLMEVTEGPIRKRMPTVEESKKREDKNKGQESVQPKAAEECTQQESEHKAESKDKEEREPADERKTYTEEPKPVVKKEVELNVFTCKTDLQEENKKIQQERLQLMDELNKSVGSRTSLNFVDKLCDRLSQGNVMIKQEPQDDALYSHPPRTLNPSPLAMPVLEKEKSLTTPTSAAVTSPSVVTVTPNKKPVLETDVTQISKSNYDVTQKNDKIITDMIQKLKGKLATSAEENVDNPLAVDDADYDSEGPPPLTHVNQLLNVKPTDESTKTLLIGGLVRVIKNSDALVFSCLVPPCLFSTEDRADFQAHCREAHKQGNATRSSTLCDMCGMEIVSTEDRSLLENLFDHTVTEHADFISGKEGDESFKPPARVLRIRKLSGDALSVTKSEPDEDNADGKGDDAKANDAVQDDDVEASAAKADKEDQNAQKVGEPSATMVELDASEDNPFPFKIAGVMSLAEPQPPPLAPILAKPVLQMGAGSQLIVKEAKLTQAELLKPRKTAKAMAKFIATVSDLYKCPHYYCLFSTNFRDFLERHLKAHKVEQDILIPCVYCDMKTPWEHVPMHIDIRHAHCRFACSYCLYRAVVKEYVFLHQDQAHPANDYSVVALPQPKHSKRFAIAEVKVDPASLCQPYTCMNACNVKFLFQNEFRRHLEVHKSNYINCGYKQCTNRVQASKMPDHWSLAHSVSLYQCGYCNYSADELKKMNHHFARSHQGLQPDVWVRQHTPQQDGLALGYTADAFKVMRKIVSISKAPDAKNPESASSENLSVLLPAMTYSKPGAYKTAPPFGKTTLQMVSSKKNVIFPAAKPGLNRTITFVSTSSGTSGPSNILLLPSVSTGSNIGGIVMTAPAPIMTAVAPSQQKENAPETDGEPGKEPQEPEQPSIEPLEHITVGEDSQGCVEDADNVDIDPLSLDLGDMSKNADGFSSGEESDEGKAEKSKKGSTSGLLSYQLYRCAFCEISFSNSADLKKHAAKSLTCRRDDGSGKPFSCVHCGKRLKNSHVLVDHIQCHGVLRFSCSLCTNKYATVSQARSHAKTRHNINQTCLTPANPNKTNIDTDEYVVRPKLVLQPLPSTEAAPAEAASSAGAAEHVYTPDQIDRIPMRHILSCTAKCGLCSYTTKVRTNMVRHLQFHSEEKAVSESAPVNPVPCLEKNEKMFDKMVNLAGSSHATSRMGGAKAEGKEKEAENLPDFVQSHCRYVCPAQNCNYLCPEEANLRHHIIALHDDETSFTCVHCKASLAQTDADGLIKHFKLHGLQLYKCQYCSFAHNLKHKVERHAGDAHLDLPVKVITVRCLEAEPKDQEPSTSGVQSAAPASTSKVHKPWRCCMCKYKSGTQEGIQHHALEKHEIDSHFKCALCTYKSNDKESFIEHFRDAHNNQSVDIIYAYRKIEEGKEKESETFDTTPLWQRDRPRVRHIRGILFDESSPVPAKAPKKTVKSAASPSPSGAKPAPAQPKPSTSKSNMDLSIESVANGTAEILKADAPSDGVVEMVTESRETGEPVDEPEAKDDDVIVIDDDDDKEVVPESAKNKDNKDAPTAKNRPLKRKCAEPAAGVAKLPKATDEVIDVEGSGSDSDTEKDEFSEKNLNVRFGGHGTPLNKQLKCPICNQFKSKRISDFIFHLFKEMKVYRFKCKICSDESITFRYMYKHIQEHNRADDCDDNIVFLPPNRALEAWLQIVIREQSLIILQNFLPAPDVKASVDKELVVCPHCEKKFQNEQEKNEHCIIHWSQKPFGCSMCRFTAYSLRDIEKHLETLHGSKMLLVNLLQHVQTKAPTVAKELKLSDVAHMREVNSRHATTSIEKPPDPEEDPLRIPGDEAAGEGPEEEAAAKGKEDGGELSDLVIVTKTDSNVPNESDVFCCEYCPFMTNSETQVLGHIAGAHEHMHVKFKTLNRVTCEANVGEYVGCMVCSEVGSEIRIRQHHIEKHDGQTFLLYRFTCLLCRKRFVKLPGLKTHFNKQHPGFQLKYEQINGEAAPEEGRAQPAPTTPRAAPSPSPSSSAQPLRRYKCSLCSYERTFPSSQLSNLRAHVKQHFKAFTCGVCLTHKFKSRWEAISHFGKEHRGMPESIIVDGDVNEEYTVAVARIIMDAREVAGAAARSTARKSTSAPKARSETEYSYYGTRAEPVDLGKIMTAVEINGMCLNMSAEKLSKIFDLNAEVVVEDCNLSVNLSTLHINFSLDDFSEDSFELDNIFPYVDSLLNNAFGGELL